MSQNTLVHQINEVLRDYLWYPEDKEKQRKALIRVEFLVTTAIMELDYSTEEGKKANE